MDVTVDGSVEGSAMPGPAQRLANGYVLNERYEIERLTGRSVYAEIYKARDVADGKLVTIKVLHAPLVADAAVRSRLEREIQTAVQLDHKNIAATVGLFGATVGNDAVAYLASEYIDGQSLREMIDKKRAGGRAFSIKGSYNVIAHLCNALVYAHAAAVHGGLSAESVMVNSAGRVKVVDFGLPRAVRPIDHFKAQVSAGGGLAALAPEMMSAPDGADARADLYSVGVILFELLTGRPPTETFERPSAVMPGVPKAVDEVVERCLRPIPDERFGDAQLLKEALHAGLAQELAGPNATNEPAAAPPAGAAPAAATPSPSAPASSAPAPKVPAPPPRPAAAAPPAPSGAPQPPTPRPPAPAAPTASAPVAARPAAASAAPGKLQSAGAMSALDDTTERWLISKDKLDFGPFSMRELRSQIESHKIEGEAFITDTETGERRRVKDHPQLRQLVMDADVKKAEKHREESEIADRRKHRGKIATMTGLFLVVLLGVGGVIMWKWRPWEKRVEKVVVHDQANLDWLKGLEISMKVDPPATKPKVRRPKKNGKPGEFEDVTNLGDASSEGGDETLDQSVVQRVMSQNFKVLVGCIQEERGRNPGLHNVDMDFIIKGTGLVSAVKVNGQTGSPLAGCMYGKMQTVNFPKFNGAKTHASFSLALK
jgi:serine/threonine-protein kinase